jgi:predicted enzyme related to lactoylglutathione lyase
MSTESAPARRLPDWPVFIMVTVDTTDPKRLADFWSAVLQVEIADERYEEVSLQRQPDRGVTLAFQRVPDPTPGKNRVHVDLLVADVATARERVLALGGTALDEHERDGYRWAVVTDPDGNQFCLIQPPPPPS